MDPQWQKSQQWLLGKWLLIEKKLKGLVRGAGDALESHLDGSYI